MRNSVYWLILLTFTYGCIEVLSYSGLYLLNKYYGLKYEPVDKLSNKQITTLNDFFERRTNYLKFSSSLGWTIKENGSSGFYKANSSGLRSNREYKLHSSNKIVRVATFGDSFTHCDEVGNTETWQSILEYLDSKLEVLNFGVPGFGLDQAYLRYLEDGLQYNPDIVFIGFMSENILRTVNTFRPFYSPGTAFPLTKPRFKQKNGKLFLVPNAMRKVEDYRMLLLAPKKYLSNIGANDYYYSIKYKAGLVDFSPTVRAIKLLRDKVSARFREHIIENGYYNETSEAYNITTNILDEFYTSVIKHKSIPIILVFPDHDDFISYRTLNKKRYLPILSYLKSKHYKYIDFMDVFETLGDDFDLNRLVVGHYSPFANKLVALSIYDYLTRFGLINSKTKVCGNADL